MKNEIKKLIGTLPYESGFKKRMRFHQGWWRAFVLAEKEGNYPHKKDAVTFAYVFGTVSSGGILLAGVNYEKADDLTLGIDPVESIEELDN